MRVEPRVSAVAAAGVIGLIGQCGGDADRIAGAARLDMRDFGNPAATLDLGRYCEMFEQAARQTGVDEFGLRFGLNYRLEDMGPLGELALNAPTLGAALKNLCRYFPAVQEHSTLALRDDGDLVRLEYQIRDGRILHRRQDAELTIGIFNTLFTRSFGAAWSPAEIHFEHPRAAQPGVHQTLLNGPVYFGQPANAILLNRHELGQKMPNARPGKIPALIAELEPRAAQARPDDLTGRIVQQIRAGFASGEHDIDHVAAKLGMSRAKLYRILAAENMNFTNLTEIIRQELAALYLAQPHITLTEIAALLGYSEPSAFTRAFKRWTSTPPSEFRARRVGGGCGK